SLAPVTARYFRFDWTPAGTEPGSEDLDAAKWKPVFKLNDLILSSEPKINQWQGKAANMWLVAPETTAEEVPDQDCLNVKDEIRLVMKGDTIVSCFPQITAIKTSKWRVLRFGHTSTGMMNSTGGGGKGLEIDKFNIEATNRLFDNWFKRFLNRPYSHVIKIFHIDSWECGSQNWGKNFADEFSSRRGYDLLSFMPLYAGIPMESASQSEHVLRDIRLTDNDLVNNHFFKILETRAHAYGKAVSHESIAPTFVADGIQHYSSADIPMGEFWLNSPTHDKPSDMLDAVSGAHLYGRNIVQAEGPTEVRGVWNETPAMVKPFIDRNFALGMNRLVFHVDAHNPWMDRKPGMTLDGIGFFFQRDNTWYPEASGLVSYITRCQRLLQQGTPVVDIAVFTGEEMPRRSITPDRMVPMLPGVFGRQRIESEQKRLANVGQPIEESPVGVYHSAGIMNLKEWINPLHGYCYDSMNPDALLNDTQVEDSCLVTPGGIHYRILVLPGKRPMDPCYHGLSPTISRRIENFRKAGVIVIDRPYKNSDFSSLGVNRDVILPEQIAYTHRTTDSTEIYFLANQEDSILNFTASFRVSHAQPELYDALSDETYLPDFWQIRGQRTNVAVHLPPQGSIFVIFKKVKGGSLSESNPDLLPLKVLKKRIPVSSTWNICFTATGKDINTKNLFDWSQSLDEKVKYYSGSALYTTSFSYKGKKGKKVELSLGILKDVARVYVNGIDCGVAWTAPYTVNISKAVHHGKNQLQIKVDNTWVNALNGATRGKAPYNGIWTNAKYRMKNKPLLVSGLLGPVVIRY
ncbi:MAG: DNA-binding protein, partial [Prevotella sp.]|nr:DNA-binding protein [Prevotella sp.]